MVHRDASVLRYTYIACLVVLSLSTADYSREFMHPSEQPATVAVFGETIKRGIMAIRVVTVTYTKFSLNEIEQ
jgi:hypothetical protein